MKRCSILCPEMSRRAECSFSLNPDYVFPVLGYGCVFTYISFEFLPVQCALYVCKDWLLYCFALSFTGVSTYFVLFFTSMQVIN